MRPTLLPSLPGTVSAVLLVLACATVSLPAQNATFARFAAACPTTTGNLVVQGLPKLGTSFTVSGIRFPDGCTFRFCGCNPGPCNSCSGSLLVIGVRRVQVPLPPSGCALRVSTEAILAGAGPAGDVVLAVPNNAVLVGYQFHMQRADVGMVETILPNCQITYPIQGFRGWSDALTGTIGL